MDILARRLTIISMLMVVFALTLAAAVSADSQRRRHNYAGSIADCTVHTRNSANKPSCEGRKQWSPSPIPQPSHCAC